MLLVKGSLAQASLGTIVQAMFECQLTAIVWMSKEMEEGVAYFHHGQLTHVESNGTTGQDALYLLSHWDKGTFRVLEQSTLPQHVSNSLLEYPKNGATAVDYNTTILSILSRPHSAQTRAHAESDALWDEEMILLLSQLENVKGDGGKWRSRFRTKRRISYDDNVGLQRMMKLVNTTAQAGDQSFDKYKTYLSTAVNLATDLYPVASQLKVKFNRLESFTPLFNNVAPAERNTFAYFLFKATIDILESYFFQLTAQFHGRDQIEQWRGVFQLFLDELGDVAERMKQ